MRPVDHGWFGPDVWTGQTAGSRAACLYWPDGEATYQETLAGGSAGERSTAIALAQALHVEPVDSLEVRWILSGAPGSAVREWFARFPAKTETREDTYLVFPPVDGLSLKFRAGRTLEAKCYLGSPGLLCLPVRGLGRLESWRKWSFPDDLLRPVDKLASAWVTVRKFRRSIRFPLSVREDPVPEPSPDDTGCTAELTEVDVAGQPMWTVALEATGPTERLPHAIRDAIRQLFASPLPSQARFSLGNSWSYTHWLYRQPNPNAARRPTDKPSFTGITGVPLGG